MTEIKNQDNIKIAVLGGDLREIAAAEVLTGQGCEVTLYGFDAYGKAVGHPAAEAPGDAAVLLLPVPAFRVERLNLPFSEARLTCRDVEAILDAPSLRTVIGGMIPEELSEAAARRGIAVCDVCREERFQILNSVPTAEGALAIAMIHLSITLHDAETAVLGYGRIGKTLCRYLIGFGTRVTAVARKEKDLTESTLCGCTSCDFGALPDRAGRFDVFFNTVPHTVITEPILRNMKEKAFIIDLASRPGGVDSDAALRYGIRVIRALSLPGKVAPISAGRILADCVLRQLREGSS